MVEVKQSPAPHSCIHNRFYTGWFLSDSLRVDFIKFLNAFFAYEIFDFGSTK